MLPEGWYSLISEGSEPLLLPPLGLLVLFLLTSSPRIPRLEHWAPVMG